VAEADIETTDAELVERARQGDRAAFGTLVERYRRTVHVIARRMTTNLTDAQDLTQESFLRAYQHLDRLRDAAAFGGWLSGIVRTTGLELARRGRIRETVPIDPDRRTGPEEHSAENAEIAEAIDAAFATLSEEARLIVTMRLVEGWNSRLIAERLGKAHGTVRSILCRSRRLLQGELEAFAPDAETRERASETSSETSGETTS